MLKGKRTKSCILTAWMTDWLTDRPTGWLIDWLTVDGAWGCIAFPNVETACWAETNNLHEDYRNKELMNKSKFPQSWSSQFPCSKQRWDWFGQTVFLYFMLCAEVGKCSPSLVSYDQIDRMFSICFSVSVKKVMDAKLCFCLMLIILGTITVQGAIPRNMKKNPSEVFARQVIRECFVWSIVGDCLFL